MPQKPPIPEDTPTEPATPEALRRRDSGEFPAASTAETLLRCPACWRGKGALPEPECSWCWGTRKLDRKTWASWHAASQGRPR